MAAAYAYDDFRVTFTPRNDGSYDARAQDAAGATVEATFTVPLDDDTLQRAILGVARSNSRKAGTRDVGTEIADELPIDATALGSALGAALLDGPIGAGYEAARRTAGEHGRGVRLSLSLAGAPGLLSVPWEFLYRRPRFLASQRKTPLVRVLDTGETAPPPAIDSKVRILGVVASPNDLNPLDVDEERNRVETALAKVKDLGRIQLDWLQPATRRRLREVLREGDYHVIHYIGHSDFTPDGEGVLYLEDDDGRAAALDSIELANLVGDLGHLRLVVLNSCEGARTTLTDPYAGVATTMIQLGVPAVVAMQFEISDQAAILFAEVLYTNLIGQQAPVDAAVAEARKAIFNEIDRVEFATPVLFVHDPDVELFRFQMPTAPLPPPPPPTFDDDDLVRTDPSSEPAPEPAADPPVRSRIKVPHLVGAAAAMALAIGVGVAVWPDDDPTDSTDATVVTTPNGSVVVTGPTTTLASTGEPRPRTGFLAVPIFESDAETHLFVIDPDDPDRPFLDPATSAARATDVHPSWDRSTNRLAFERTRDATTGIFYVVPGDGGDDAGKQVQPLVVPEDGAAARRPSWSGEAEVVYSLTDGCSPGAGCDESIRRATFSVSDEAPAEGGTFLGFRSLDNLQPADDVALATGFTAVVDVAADQSGSGRVAVADAAGLWMIDGAGARLIERGLDVAAMAFTPDGSALVVGENESDAGALISVYSPEGVRLSTISVAELDAQFDDAVLEGQAFAMTPGAEDRRVGAVIDRRGGGVPPLLAGLEVTGGRLTVTSANESPEWLQQQGLVRGIAL